MKVPFLDLQTPHRELWPVVKDRLEQAFCNAAFIGGPEVTAFEDEFAAYVGTPFSAAVASGTDALMLAFVAMGIGRGDEVITVPHTFIATTEAISQTGATPVFVDIEPVTYTMDPAKIEAAITPRTKAIVPVHIYGQCADMDAIWDIAKRHNLYVVEDAAQAHGATYKGKPAGSMSHMSAFSFYPGKNLGACGEGGAVASCDPDLIAKVKMLRDHGQAQKYYHDVEGYNGRLDALQCLVLREKLRRLPDWNKGRQRAAAQYDKRLSNVAGVTPPPVSAHLGHVYHIYMVLVENRDDVKHALEDRGIGCGLHYPLPLHLQNAYAGRGYKEGDFPVTESVAKRLLSLPMFPHITEAEVDYVCDTLIEIVTQ